MSGTPIASTDTYENPSLASMGLIIGSHVWSWGAAPAQSFILKIELSSRVVLSGNDLIIEEIGSVDTDDTWQLSTDGSNIIVFDPNDLISTNIPSRPVTARIPSTSPSAASRATSSSTDWVVTIV